MKGKSSGPGLGVQLEDLKAGEGLIEISSKIMEWRCLESNPTENYMSPIRGETRHRTSVRRPTGNGLKVPSYKLNCLAHLMAYLVC